ILIFCHLSFSQSDTIKIADEIKFIKKLHDFGDVTEGDSVKYVFKFQNVGDRPLKINGLVTTCSCTGAVSDTAKVYKPGDTGEITVGYGSKGKSGIIQKQVAVFYGANAEERKVAMISIRLNVLPKKKK
ncbi:MAG: DUF1573 domain-containing protein, partial [Cytophagaceae bacterium]|nr:DUF1573 domain-containing protein [Cytophagaceae bacterium]